MAGYLMGIADQEFERMRKIIHARFGINLTEHKRSLLVGRLQKHIATLGFHSFQEYYEHLVADTTEKALCELVDRISTNHTYFNREKSHFDFFVDTVLPGLVESQGRSASRDIRVWCAGCSTGEEPFMLLMLMREFFGADYEQWEAGILATDISQRALDIARAGVYSEDRVRALPESLLRKYLSKLPDGNWVVNDLLRREAVFRRFNLMNETFPFKKKFHVIFCRNVMIYFDKETRGSLLGKFYDCLESGGYLFIGHSETLGREQKRFQYLVPAVYQKTGAL